MILKRIYTYFLLTVFALIFTACRGVSPTQLMISSPVASQQAHDTVEFHSVLTATTVFQPPASGTPSILPELIPSEQSPARTPATATPQASGYPSEWTTYSSDTQPAFYFEYPSLYDSQAYSGCKITQGSADNYLLYLRFGYRSELAVADNDLHSLDMYIERWRQGKDIESENARTINGLPGVSFDYRFGGTDRFGSSTFIGQDDLLYIFNFTAGGTCDLAELNLNELSIYKHAVETFRLGATSP